MPDLRLSDTSGEKTENMVEVINTIKKMVKAQRHDHERRWYDNNFFDDGYHYRFIHRTTDRIVDLAQKNVMWEPKRAIPKSSRQIRGIANLMLSFDWHPIIYPARVNKSVFLKGQPDFGPDLQDPATGEVVPNPDKLAYEKHKQLVNREAKMKGYWLEDEWKKQEMFEDKLPLMVLLTMKNGVSFIECWPDSEKEEIKSEVYDAFEIYVNGVLKDLQHSPFIGKVVPYTIREIKANEEYDEKQREQLNPDNKYADSEVKEAYLTSRYGGNLGSDASATILLNEFFVKETISNNNLSKIAKQENGDEIMDDRDKGDTVIRQITTAGGVWLKDEYINLKKYPFVDFKMEPGAIWQTPQIERFIPINKSYNSIISKIERYIQMSPLGVWTKRKGEDFKLTNVSGAQVVRYKATPPQQATLGNLPPAIFNLLALEESMIEEQGVTTTSMGKLPKGVKAHAAIESLKASEFSNLTMPLNQLKKTVKEISEMFIEYADEYYVTPKEVTYTDKNESEYFDVIGSKGLDLQKKVKNQLPENIIVMEKDNKVRIEVETGPGYTMEGKRANTLEVVRLMSEMAANGLITPKALQNVVTKLLETYQFGNTAEFVEAMDEGATQGGMPQDQKQVMKEAVAEVLMDIKNAQMGEQAPAVQPPVQG